MQPQAQAARKVSPDRILVRFKDTAPEAVRAAHRRAVKVQKVRDMGTLVPGLQVWRLPPGQSVEAALELLRGEPDIAYAEADPIVHVLTTPNDSSFSALWGLHNTGQSGGVVDADVDAPEAWDTTTGTDSVVVGVVDTGIDWNHEDLKDNMWINLGEVAGNGVDDDGNGYVDDVHGWNAITETGNAMDDHNHGSHCAGTIGARGNNGIGVVGVSWRVKLMALKFLNASGTGSTSDAVELVNYAVSMKRRGVNIRVLSNSWGGEGFSQALSDAIQAAAAEDILFVAAAGNNSRDTDLTAYYPQGYDSPNVISVAATGASDELASFSNFGRTSVDLGAPGVNVFSTTRNNAYSSFSGTSMATPHVSGAAALMLAKNGTLTSSQIKSILMQTADPISSLSGKTVTGARLNVNRALAQVSPPPGFDLAVSPATAFINQGQAAHYTVESLPRGNFTGNVSLSVSASPALSGATVSISPNPIPANGSAMVSIATTTGTATGIYQLTITGTSGSDTVTASARLSVDPEGTIVVSYSSPSSSPIPDDTPGGVVNSLQIPDSLHILSAQVDVDITHPNVGDLQVTVSTGRGNTEVLHERVGGDADDLHQTYDVPVAIGQNSQGTWRLTARDLESDNAGTLNRWAVTIRGYPEAPPLADTSPPSVLLTAPGGGASVTGKVTVSATATDNVAVSEVRFFANGVLFAVDPTAPYSVTWDSRSVDNGTHQLSAEASDGAGLVSTSPAVSVSVTNDKTPPVISNVRTPKLSPTTATIAWATDEVSNSQVLYGTTSDLGLKTPLDGEDVTNHRVTVTGLTRNTTYHYRVRSVDPAGNAARSAIDTFTTPATDTVKITKAEWRATLRLLVIEGTCNEPTSALTATFGDRTAPVSLNNGSFKQYYTNVTSNPGTVTVRSSNGGSDTEDVTRQ